MKKPIFPIVLFAAVALAVCAAAPESSNQDGIAALGGGDAAKAGRSFQLALDQHGPSAALYFNRGLAAMEAGEIPQAMVSFLRATALDPSQSEANSALRQLAMENNLLLPTPPAWVALARQIGVGPLWVMGSIFSWVAVIALGVAAFRSQRRGWLLFAGVCLLTLGSASLAGAWLADPLVSERNWAVVDSTKPVAARSNPVETSGAVENLPPGSVIQILSERANWVYCVLPTGKNGWLTSEQILAVIP